MSRQRFGRDDPNDAAASHDRVVGELERYAMASDSEAPSGLSDRIMAAVEREPAPRSGFLAWLTGPAGASGGPGRFLRVGAMAATLVLAVAGALFAGQIADLVRDVGHEPSPTPSLSPSPSPSPVPIPSSTVSPNPSATPGSSEDDGGPGGQETVQPTAQQTPGATPEQTTEESKTPRPSPTATASPSATATQTP